MSIKYCESFKWFPWLKKVMGPTTTYLTSQFRHQRKIAWIWLHSAQHWSLQQWLITERVLAKYIKNLFKFSLNVFDGLGLIFILKIFFCCYIYDMVGVNGLMMNIAIWSVSKHPWWLSLGFHSCPSILDNDY